VTGHSAVTKSTDTASPRGRISPDLVGQELPPLDWSWDEADVMLYALGVGAAAPGGWRAPATTAASGARGSKAPNWKDRLTVAVSSPARAALHRLSGDRNPVHIDPGFSQRAGFDAPILHGLCTFGMVGLDVVAQICPTAPGRLREIAGRFASPVLPGEDLRTEVWRSEPGFARLCTRVDERTVLANDQVRYDVP
jgi:acyl dehydratase